MFTAYTCQDKLVRAKHCRKTDGPFTCPSCQQGVVLKRGHIKRPHFAHLTRSDCRYGTGESEAHRLAKFEIYDALQRRPQVTNLHVEYTLGNRRADVFFCLANRHQIAVEIQFSPLSIEELIKRTQHYANHGVHILWMPPYRHELERERYTPQPWEQYLHTLYFGVVYYWCEGDIIQPVRLEPLRLVRQGADRIAQQGHLRVHPRERVPILLPRTCITQLQSLPRKDWYYRDYYFPASLLWGLNTPARTSKLLRMTTASRVVADDNLH